MIPFPEIDESIVGPSRYALVRHCISTGDGIEFRGTSPVAMAIRVRTGMKVNHTAMAFRYVMEGDTYPRISISEATARGVEPAFLSKVLDGYDGQAYLVRCLLGAEDRIKLAKAMLSFEADTGRERVRYDYWSLVSMLFRPRVRLGGRFLFCSESLQAAGIKPGIISDKVNKGLAIVPGELHLLGIYEARSFRIY